jgi:5-hydroxyisourate hydrolase
MAKISTHVLDISRGRPAVGVEIELQYLECGSWATIGRLVTNADGRTDAPLLSADAFRSGTYMLLFHMGAYFSNNDGVPSDQFIDVVPVRFVADSDSGEYHVPLLATPWCYSTYRGS